MAQIHTITNVNPLVENKVNFFADCFTYIATYMGASAYWPVENPLSLIEKIIFQIEENISSSNQYLNNYFSNHFINNNELMNGFDNYDKVKAFINAYNSSNGKIKWLNDQPDFLPALIDLRNELRNSMFKKSLNAIISYLKCEHEIQDHAEDLKLHTLIIVTELFLNGIDRKFLQKTFDNIITKSIDKFPFPKNIKTQKQKQLFFSNMTFDQQFEGLQNLLVKEKKSAFFFFKVYGIHGTENLKFKYNKVTFINSTNPILDKAKKNIENDFFRNSFFSDDSYIVAFVKVYFHDQENGRELAIKIIREELKYIRTCGESNIYLNPFVHLVTINFKRFGGGWSSNNKGLRITPNVVENIKDNPFLFLKRHKGDCVNNILNAEYLFIAAYESRKISDYWHYLEVLIPKDMDGKQIKSVVSNALLSQAMNFYERRVHSYVVSSIASADPSFLQISDEDFRKYSYNLNIPLAKIKISHPFLNYIIADWQNKKKASDFKYLQSYYNSILTEAYEIRNSYIHEGVIQEKALLKIYYTLPNLVVRFRWAIFEEIKKGKWDKFEDLINHLKQNGKTLADA